MHKPIIFGKGFENDLKSVMLPFPAEIHNNVIDPKIGKCGGKRILNIVGECPPFRSPNDAIITRSHEFDLILTFDEDILAMCSNASKMLFGTSWIRPEDREDTWNDKKFGISFICGSKNKSEGHKLRHKIWARQDEFEIPTKFWTSSRNPIPSNGLVLPMKPSDKRLVFNQQFHIVIENVRAKNYFTEKLIDCFMTKTIPIYWGCPNITDFFDEFGIYSLDKDGDILIKGSCLFRNYSYKIFLAKIEKNYQLALPYARPFWIRLQEKIIEALK